jgi:hypothetical protein
MENPLLILLQKKIGFGFEHLKKCTSYALKKHFSLHLEALMFKLIHISSENLFHKRQPFTENELSGANYSGIYNLNLCALVLLLLALLTNFIKSNKYTGQFLNNFVHHH